MPAGRRRSLVQFYRATVTQNTSGEDVSTESQIGSAWVDVEALAGRELERAQQRQAEAQFRITMDHPLSAMSIRRKDVITWGDRRLDILDCEDPDQRRRQLVLLAKEYVS